MSNIKILAGNYYEVRYVKERNLYFIRVDDIELPVQNPFLEHHFNNESESRDEKINSFL